MSTSAKAIFDAKKQAESKPRNKRKRTGSIYSEWQRNLGGKGHGRGGELHATKLVKGVGAVETGGRLRWVGEIYYYGKRFRFRSTNFSNVKAWVTHMADILNED